MKRFLSIFMAICLIFILSFGMTGNVYAASKTIHLDKSTMYVTLGGGITQHLLTGSGKKIKASKVIWTSSDKKIATVSKSGKVTGKKKGTVTIKAKYKGKTYKCKAYVKYATKAVKDITLYKDQTAKQVIYAASGNEASVNKVKFSSRDEKIAKVDNEGTITAVSEGIVKIDAEYFGIKYIATVTVIKTEEKKEENKEEPKEDQPAMIVGGGSGGAASGGASEEPSKEEKIIDRNLSDITYDEYKYMKENNTLDAFIAEIKGKYSKREFSDWQNKMIKQENDEKNKHNYIEHITFS